MMVAQSAGAPVIAEIVTVAAGETPGTPCGGCRQRIREFSIDSTQIHSTTPTGIVLTMSMEELLPASFGPERLL
jgi:cytidine deaminase